MKWAISFALKPVPVICRCDNESWIRLWVRKTKIMLQSANLYEEAESIHIFDGMTWEEVTALAGDVNNVIRLYDERKNAGVRLLDT